MLLQMDLVTSRALKDNYGSDFEKFTMDDPDGHTWRMEFVGFNDEGRAILRFAEMITVGAGQRRN